MKRLTYYQPLLVLLLSTILFSNAEAQNFEWAQFLQPTDGHPFTGITDMAKDDDGNIYTLGEFDQNSFIGEDTIQIHTFERTSCYLNKFSPEGELLWIYPFGSKNYDFGKNLVFAGGHLFASVYLQGDTTYHKDGQFPNKPGDDSNIIKFDTDGAYVAHTQYSRQSYITALEKVDTMLYAAHRNKVFKLNFDLESVGSITFGTSSYVDIQQIVNVNDTSVLVGGIFGTNISIDGTTFNDTLSGTGATAFLANINTKNSLNWMQIFGRIHSGYDLNLAYAPGTSDFYFSGNYQLPFQLGSELMALKYAGPIHSFVAKASINDGSISKTGRIDPTTSSTQLRTNLLLTNGQSVFVGGQTNYGALTYNNEADTLSFEGSRFGQIYKLSNDLDYNYGVAFGEKVNYGTLIGAGVLDHDRLYIGSSIGGNETQIGCDTYDKGGQAVFLMEDAAPDETPSVRFILSSASGGKVTIINTILSNSDYHYWDFDDGTPFDSVTIRPVHVYERKGEINITLHAGNKCGESSFTKTLRIKGMGYLLPDKTANTNLYVGTVKGVGLKEGATFRLITAQGEEKEIREVNYIDSTSYNIIVEFENDPLVTYDLYMKNGDEADTLRNALTVNEAEPVSILCEFTGPPTVLSSRFFHYNLRVTNTSNVTAYGVPISIVGRAGDIIYMEGRTELVRNEISDKWLKEMGGHWKTMTNKATGNSYQIATFIIPILPPGKDFFFQFTLQSNTGGEGALTAFYNHTMFDVTDFFLDDQNTSVDSLLCPSNEITDRILALFGLPTGEEAGFSIDNLGCILYSYLVEVFGGGVLGGGGIGGGNDTGTYLGNPTGYPSGTAAINIGPLILESLATVYPEKSKEEIVQRLDALTDLLPNQTEYYYEEEDDGWGDWDGEGEEPEKPPRTECYIKGCLLPLIGPGRTECLIKDCLLPLPEPWPLEPLEPSDTSCEGMDCSEVLTPPEPSIWKLLFEAYWKFVTIEALDPNEKYPIQGLDENNYIAQGRELNYHITFENADTATAPASEVFVYDTLDLNVMDTTNFSWNSFGFGDINITLQAQGTHVIEDVDLRPYGGNAIVRFEGKVDSTGVLSAVFTTMDTATMVLTENVLDGFLPPNQTKPEGEGYFNFSIAQQPDLASGTRIENTASIIFDRNEPIVTGMALNTIDHERPNSFVIPFEHTEQYDSVLHVDFSGFDAESGIRGFNVYVNVNDNGYRLFAREYEYDYMDIAATYGNTYSFIVQAVDNVNNWESKAFEEEARISIVKKVTGLNDELNNKIILYPNPTSGELSIQSKLNESIYSYRVIDLTGKVVKSGNLNRHSIGILNIKDLKTGVYIMDLETSAGTVRKKIIKK